MCRVDGSVFPFNAAYYTTSWIQGRRTNKRRLVSLPEDFDDDASEDAFVFVDDAEDHEDASSVRTDEAAQRELGSKSSKSSKGSSSGRYYWQSYGGPPPPG